MKKVMFLRISFLVILYSCGNRPTKSNNTVKEETQEKAPSGYVAAFAGQTRVKQVVTQTPYEIKMVSDKFNSPWGICPMPDGRLLVTEKKGKLYIVTTTGTKSEAINGLPEVNDAGQGGLLGVTIDPAFTSNRMIYWTFAEKTTGGNLTAVAKGKLSVDEKSLENVSVIYRATPAYDGTLHYGSRILFDKTGNIIFSTGERSDKETRPQAQFLNSSLGKVIRITTDGKPAAGNPLAATAGARPELYSYGHRNVQGLAMHPTTGDLWEGEFGPRGGDEINLIQPGKNYGWPTISYGMEYSGGKIGNGITQKEGLEQPVYYWDPVISPSGMTFYNSDNMPEWKNNLFITGLSSQRIVRLVVENNKVTGEEKLLADEKQRFRDVTMGTDGALYALTDGGRLYRVGKK